MYKLTQPQLGIFLECVRFPQSAQYSLPACLELDKLVDDFKIYADEGTLGYDYAKACEIETVTGTAQIGGKNVDKGFIYAVSGIAGGIILAVIGVVTGSRIRKGGKKK